MHGFEALSQRVALSPAVRGDRWTLYHARTDDLVARTVDRDRADWGTTCIYRFDRRWSPEVIPRWLELCSAVEAELARVGVADQVRLVPYYEIGSDYLAQPSPPNDGGYSTAHFAEFVEHASCKPGPGFVRARAELLDVLIERYNTVDSELRPVIHDSLVRSCGELFWDDSQAIPWTLFRPAVGDDRFD